MIPLVVVVLIGLVLALLGLALFNLPILDVIGALLFGVLLLGGLVMALILTGELIASPLLMPALAVEGSDAFDAISRAFNYIIGRPWRYLFYNLVMVVYGAITYLFVGLIVFVALWCTKVAMGLWVFTSVGEGANAVNRFDAILPAPQLGELVPAVDWAALHGSSWLAAWIIMVWVKLLIALLPAFAVSFFFCEQTWIYLLLRRSADGSELDEVHLEPQDQPDTTHTGQGGAERERKQCGERGVMRVRVGRGVWARTGAWRGARNPELRCAQHRLKHRARSRSARSF